MKKILGKINKAVGFKLVTKFGTQGVINLVKIIPFVSGVISASTDAIATNTIGKIAKKTFWEEESVEVQEVD